MVACDVDAGFVARLGAAAAKFRKRVAEPVRRDGCARFTRRSCETLDTTGHGGLGNGARCRRAGSRGTPPTSGEADRPPGDDGAASDAVDRADTCRAVPGRRRTAGSASAYERGADRAGT